MSDTTMTIFAIFLAGIVMFIVPLTASADKADTVSQELVQTQVTQFVDNARSTGKITANDYDILLSNLNKTGHAYKVDIEHQAIDENANKKTTQASATKVGQNTYISYYTNHIYNEMEANGEYLLKQGDIIKVTVKNASPTIAQTLKGFLYRTTDDTSAVIAGSSSGIVNVNG